MATTKATATVKKTTKAKAKEKPVTETKDVAVVQPSGGTAVAPISAMHTNVEITDMKRPNLRLLQALSPEVKDLGCEPGQFYVNVLGMEIGKEVECTVLGLRKRYILWNPQRNVEPMILARSDDGITWNEGDENKTFEVVIKNVGKVKWSTKGSVAESGLHLFGSSVPTDKNSRPAAAETFDYLLYLHYQDILPVVLSLSRSKIDAAKSLATICFGNTRIDPRSLRLKLRVVTKQSEDGEFYNLVPMRSGKLDEAVYREMVALSDKFANFVADAEPEEPVSGGRREANVDPSKLANTEY